MSTRSIICYKNENNEYVGVYCHQDGFPKYVGARLLSIYNTLKKVESLIFCGDMISITDFIRNKDDSITFLEKPFYYNNDEPIDVRGSYKEFNYGQDFTYIFEDGKWFYCNIYRKDGKDKHHKEELTKEICGLL